MELKTIHVTEVKMFTYKRIGYTKDHPTDGNLIWHFDCLGYWKGEYDTDGERWYHHIGYDEIDGLVISAPTELDAIRIACEKIDNNLNEFIHWTVELVGTALRNYTKPIVMKSDTGA